MAEQLRRNGGTAEESGRNLPLLTEEVPFWRDGLGRARIAGYRLISAVPSIGIGVVVTLIAWYFLGEPQSATDYVWFIVAVGVPGALWIVFSEQRRRRRRTDIERNTA